MNKEIIKKIFPKEAKRIEEGRCPFCGEEIHLGDFKDELSKTEFEISGLCQKCQDKTFDLKCPKKKSKRK